MVYAVGMVYTVDMVYTAHMVYAVDTVYTVHMVNTIDMVYTDHMVYVLRWFTLLCVDMGYEGAEEAKGDEGDHYGKDRAAG